MKITYKETRTIDNESIKQEYGIDFNSIPRSMLERCVDYTVQLIKSTVEDLTKISHLIFEDD